MYIHYTLGAIFIVFILCVHCDNGVTNNEILEIYVPSAPQNITANRVTATEIHLLWAPPITYTIHLRSKPVDPTDMQTSKPESEPNLTVIAKEETQADEPKVPIDPIDDHLILDTPINQERPKDVDYTYNLYRNDERKYNNQFSESDILYRNKRDERSWNGRRRYYNQFSNTEHLFRIKRDTRSHRHRKRRQDNVTEKIHFERNDGIETHQAFELPIEVVKKSMSVPLRKDITQIAYVLYYEEGVAMKKGGSDFLMVTGAQTSEDVKRKNVFRSDLGIQDYLNATKNLTLLNTSGAQSSKLVGFRLRNLKPFTPYKIWVRAFYNFPLEGVMSSDLLERLGPQGESLYVLTDVRPPSAPVILNLTCEQPNGILYLQWRQPREYDNSLDQYVVTLRKIPEKQPRTRLTLPTTKDDIETTISVKVELWNVTRYEVKIYAVTQSVASPNALINGSESPAQEVSSELCTAHSEAMSPADVSQVKQSGNSLVALVAAALLTILAAVSAALVYWRCRSRVSKCISAAYNYLEEGGERAARAPLNTYKKPVVNCSPLVSCAGGNGATAEGPAAARPPRMAGSAHPLVRARQFPAHVAALHADGDIGFSKEYEIVVSNSAALGHTSHHSYRPENRLKNRYLNITAYDHSRVCVSSGGRCGAAGCVGAGRGASCDYVNANFIDGMLPALNAQAAARIERKLAQRARPNRQPSVKASKPPPNLAEGIESAFLNIEFSGIVESEDQAEDSDSDRSDDDSELDDVYVEINGVPRQIKLEWAVWRRRYIATQGPTPATLDAFWRMIWQHRVHTLVMITNLVERGRRKCDMYWPAGGRGSSADFGGIHVTLLYEDVRAAYTVRHLRVRGKPQPIIVPQGSESSSESSSAPTASNNEGRHIVQYHYTVWPDHGTPRHPLAVLPFVRAAADPGTVLVHCSAGVGRTGTYIVIDAQLNQLKLTGTLSPLGFLCRARTQRNHLVQTEEQYVFVHDALLEYVRSGNTEVEFTKAREYLAKLLEPISDEELAVMDLNPPKRKSVNDLTNGNGGSNGSNLKNDVSSLKSASQSVSEQIVENGSQASIKTDELNTESKSSDVEQGGLVNGGDDVEGVYDLAPRSTDTYNKKMQAYNNMNEQEKEEMRRVNRAENYALLERMRSLSNRHQLYQGPPPVNLLEKQFQLITRSCVEPSVCARAAHNADKNRPGGILPSDSARVMLVPKPGVEGSEYVNASWVCGRRRMREYAVAQHPGDSPELWRLLWDHTAQLVLLLADNPADPDCDVFWPTEEENELFVANFRASFVSKDTYVAYRRSERKAPSESPTVPQTNGYRRTEGSECADDERLIPENTSPANDSPKPAYRFDRTELRLERLSGNRDLSARKSIANGDLFSSLSEKKNGPKSPRSPSKMSLKNFKLGSPTKFKFPEWGSRTAGSPPDTAPPPPPIAPSLTVQEEAELRRPVYVFERVNSVPEVSSDRVIEVTNVSVHSLQDDYQLSVKFIKCSGWLDGRTSDYVMSRPDDNECVRAVRQASCASEREEAIDRLIAPFEDSFALIEFVAACQMEYKNGPVVVVDKYGGWRALTFCSLSAACGGVRNPAISEPGAEFAPPCTSADLYCSSALNAHARCAPNAQTHNHCASPQGSGSLAEPPQAHSPKALLAAYSALAAYSHKLPRPDS